MKKISFEKFVGIVSSLKKDGYTFEVSHEFPLFITVGEGKFIHISNEDDDTMLISEEDIESIAYGFSVIRIKLKDGLKAWGHNPLLVSATKTVKIHKNFDKMA